MNALVTLVRVVFGAWLLASGLNHFWFDWWAEPTGQQALAVQLMDGFVHSGLLDVAMVIHLVAGALILVGVLAPLALAVVMPVSTCALFWAAILDHQALGTVLALVVFLANGLLMLAYIDHYRGTLQWRPRTLGENARSVTYEDLFASPAGVTTRNQYLPALLTLLAAIVFYYMLVRSRTGMWTQLTLLYPAAVLHARRLNDMGVSGWLVLVPLALLVGAFMMWLGYITPSATVAAALPKAAFAVAGALVLWCALGRSRP